MRLSGLVAMGLGLAACVACAGRAPSAPAQLPTAHVALPSPASPPAPAGRISTSRAGAPTIEPTPAARATAAPATALPTAFTTAAPAQADAGQATLEALLIVEINRVRSANQLPPYQASPELSAAARAHSCDLASHHLISHVSSDGRTLADRLAGSTPPWEWPSESIAAGTDDPALVVAMWMDEPPEGWHRRNILDVEQRAVGAGYCFADDDPSGNRHYWTADFSRRAGDTP